MRRYIALLLLLSMLAAVLLFTASCKEEAPPNEEKPPQTELPPENPEDNLPTIKVPDYKDYGRGTANFKDVIYSRPDIDAAVALFGEAEEVILQNAIPYEQQLQKLLKINEAYRNLVSMQAMATIYSYKDSSNEFWNAEFKYISENFPKFTKATEELFVAAAKSPHKANFENDFFGSLDEYVNGGIYTDEAVKLMSEEASYEAEYSALGPSNVIISYEGVTDTYEKIVNYYLNTYGKTSKEYLKASRLCYGIYTEALLELQTDIFVDLVKVRKLISDELGYESYEEYAYKTLYHDYEKEEMEELIEEVTEYVIPAYLSLRKELFASYIDHYEKTNQQDSPDRVEIINTLYDVYKEASPELSEIYSYMLQHSLFDVEDGNDNRFDGAFTTYIESQNAPFLFVSLTGSVLDYSSVAHEFGHFADNYINYGSSSSLDLSEVSSQALELLTMLKLDGKFDNESYKYFSYLKISEIFETIIYQSFYASFEIDAYQLPYADISEEKLSEVVRENAKDFFGLSSNWNIKHVLIPHLFIYPFYVQSYSTSAISALEIYCLEKENTGTGFAAYRQLISRNFGAVSFEEALTNAGLHSPFADGSLKTISDKVHYLILGAHCFTDKNNNSSNNTV